MLGAGSVRGATGAQQFWDPNRTGGTSFGGSGQWDTTSAFWWTAAGGDTFWVDGSSAVFSGVAGNVTISGTRTASGLVFNTSGYNILSGSLILGAPATIQVATGVEQMGAVLSGSAGFTLQGSGTTTLTLSGSNTYAGPTIVSGASACACQRSRIPRASCEAATSFIDGG